MVSLPILTKRKFKVGRCVILKEEEERIGLAGGKDAQSRSRAQKADLIALEVWVGGATDTRDCAVPGRSQGT